MKGKEQEWSIKFRFSDMSKGEREFFTKACKTAIDAINTARQQDGREQAECYITKHNKQEHDRIKADMIAFLAINMLLGIVSIIGLILR